jgi:hypothetical protein
MKIRLFLVEVLTSFIVPSSTYTIVSAEGCSLISWAVKSQEESYLKHICTQKYRDENTEILKNYYSLLFNSIHYYSLLFTTIHYYSLLFTTIHYYSLLLTSIHYYSLSKLLLLVIWWRYSESSYLLVEWFVEVALHEVLGFSLLNSAVSHYSTCTSTESHISSWFFPPLSIASKVFSYRRLINV